jgi:hypothetical protein
MTTVLRVIHAARSPCVEDDQAMAEADLPRAITAVRGIARTVVKAVRGVVCTACSPRVDDNHYEADLVRAA